MGERKQRKEQARELDQLERGRAKDDPARVFNPTTDGIAACRSEQEEVPKMAHMDGKLDQDHRT
jgi:hypothetical protein